MATILARLMNMVASPELKAKDGAAAAGAYERRVQEGKPIVGGVRSNLDKINAKKIPHKGEQIRTTSPITGTRG